MFNDKRVSDQQKADIVILICHIQYSPFSFQQAHIGQVSRTDWKYMIYGGFIKYMGTPKSSILIGLSILNHPFWGIPILGNPRNDEKNWVDGQQYDLNSFLWPHWGVDRISTNANNWTKCTIPWYTFTVDQDQDWYYSNSPWHWWMEVSHFPCSATPDARELKRVSKAQ